MQKPWKDDPGVALMVQPYPLAREPYCPVCHNHGRHGPRCEGIGWRDGVGEPIQPEQ